MLYSLRKHIAARERSRADIVSDFAIAQCHTLGVPPYFLELLLVIEDKRFLTHVGIDIIALVRALRSNFRKAAYLQGASTLAQQIYNVRSKDSVVGRPKRSFRRKGKKLVFGVWLTYHNSKIAILREYLCGVYWGRLFYGVEAASIGYFGKTPNELSFEESFFLVERLASPNRVRLLRLEVILRRDVVRSLLHQNQSSVSQILGVYKSVFDNIHEE